MFGLWIGLGLKGVELLAAPSQFDPGSCLGPVGQSKLLDLGRPVVQTLVLGGGRELEVVGREVDDSIPRVAVVVPAGVE